MVKPSPSKWGSTDHVMSGSPSLFGASAEHDTVGPDYFGFYTRELAHLLSQHDDFLQFFPQWSTFIGGVPGVDIDKNLIENDRQPSDNLFSRPIGADFSDFEKERLRSLVRESLFTFAREVDEMLHPILSLSRMRSSLEDKNNTSSLCSQTTMSNQDHHPEKKQKVASSSVGDDLQYMISKDSRVVEKYVKKCSDELLDMVGVKCFLREIFDAQIAYMEQKLEEYIDILLSKCRPMTLLEKQKLLKMIQDLPPRNMDRAVEIITRNRPLDKCSCDEIYVDLENENKVTLWRLYYHVEAVQNARKLCDS